LRRLLVDGEAADQVTGKVNWVNANTAGVDRADNFLIDLASVESGQPITAAAAVTIGDVIRDGSGAIIDANLDGKADLFDRERWVYFGTGRFLVRDDADNIDQQSYYGLKEPRSALDVFDGTSVTRATLVNVTNAEVFDDETVTGVTNGGTITTWDELLDSVDERDGWYLNFADQKERNLGQAVLLGEVLTFTTYVPALDVCAFEGESWLYALHFKTGTAYPDPIVGFFHNDSDGDGIIDDGEKRSRSRVSLGRGLALTPNVHTGKEEGSRAFVQTSTGAIETIEEVNPGLSKSGKSSWLQR
jgi:type IV pilus assembly protein PilY1